MMAGRNARARPAVPFCVAALVVLVGFAFIVLYHWRIGAGLIALALLFCALVRATLGPEHLGLLAMRSKPVDVLLYGGFGALMLVVDLTIVGGPFS